MYAIVAENGPTAEFTFYIGLFREKTLSFFQSTPRAFSIVLYKVLVVVLKGGSKSRESSLYMGLDARKPGFGGCEQQRRRPACASERTDQRLCYSRYRKYHP